MRCCFGDDFRGIEHVFDIGRHPALTESVERAIPMFTIPMLCRTPARGPSEIQAPVAMVIMFGFLSSAALNMLVVPAVRARSLLKNVA